MGQCVPSSTPNGAGGNGGSGGGASGGGGAGGANGGGGGGGCGCAAPARQRGGTTGAFLLVIVFGLGVRRLRFTMEK
jgi:MYXO-CTERM domain-containing protein